MVLHSCIASVDRLVSMVVESGDPVELGDLATALDTVALEVGQLKHPPFDPTHWPQPPRRAHQEAYRAVGARFPQLGLYVTVLEPLDVGAQQLGTGDAVDDLTDIVLDLKDARWRWMNTSQLDAIWHLRRSFEAHWGKHLRSLQVVVHLLLTRA